MKRLLILIISAVVSVGVLAACGTGGAGKLGPVPTGSAGATGAASPTGAAGSAASPHPSGPAGTAQPTAPAATPSQGAAGEVSLQTWFTRQGKLFGTEHGVPATVSVGRAALDQLLAGPSSAEYAAGLRSQIPAGTQLLGLTISSRTATVDLSSSFVSAAGPSVMPLRIAQVVYTLGQFPTVTGVLFKVDGQGVTVLGGVPVQGPQTTAMYDGYLPAIIVQNPAIGEQVSSPVTVSGTADVFEAVVSVRILDSAGNQIARTFGTASCGTGCRGGYSVPVSYSVTRQEPGTIEVFESSAKDGQPVNVQQIPVTLVP
jgi:Immunoglobulin-like domain of bacterial spore germination/Sporulation and spore germination